MTSAAVSPITDDDVPAAGLFLHQNLNRRISAERWSESLQHRWAENPPNHGAKLVHDGRIVGVCCAIYSDQLVDGKVERFCNPHSWAVLDEFRNSSINLVLYLVKQKGWHFSMLTPNPKVEQIFRHLGFKDLPKDMLFLPNLPSPRAFSAKAVIETRAERIEALLSPGAAKEYRDHASIPWLQSVVIGAPGDTCLVFYKPMRKKKLPGARILGLTDRGAFSRHFGLLGHHLLLQRGLVFTRIERRLVDDIPPWPLHTTRSEPKLFLSKTMDPRHFRDMYTELMALDI